MTVKDLVTIGIFAVVYSVVMFVTGCMGFVPILYLVWPTVCAIVGGVVIMLFMAKVQKPWALLILGMIVPLATFAMGYTFIVPLISLIVMLIAEFIRRMGDYKSFKCNMLSYAFFSLWTCSSLSQILLVKERYMEMVATMMGPDYLNALEKLITYPSMALVALGAFLGGIAGAFLGKAMLKKHFEKAGVV
nr:MptD family putative ECF transporter S component [Collinsella urealyticum]